MDINLFTTKNFSEGTYQFHTLEDEHIIADFNFSSYLCVFGFIFIKIELLLLFFLKKIHSLPFYHVFFSSCFSTLTLLYGFIFRLSQLVLG